jgi:hypothetical protein
MLRNLDIHGYNRKKVPHEEQERWREAVNIGWIMLDVFYRTEK